MRKKSIQEVWRQIYSAHSTYAVNCQQPHCTLSTYENASPLNLPEHEQVHSGLFRFLILSNLLILFISDRAVCLVQLICCSVRSELNTLTDSASRIKAENLVTNPSYTWEMVLWWLAVTVVEERLIASFFGLRKESEFSVYKANWTVEICKNFR